MGRGRRGLWVRLEEMWVPAPRCPAPLPHPPLPSPAPRPEERRFAVFSLAVGPDGREVVGGANDGCLYIYDREVQRRVLRVSPTARAGAGAGWATPLPVGVGVRGWGPCGAAP